MEAQYVAVEEVGTVLIWTDGAASDGQDVIYAHGIQMIKQHKALTGSKDGGAPSVQAEQGDLWLEPHTSHPDKRTPASSTTSTDDP
jgi:hypothetical protein